MIPTRVPGLWGWGADFSRTRPGRVRVTVTVTARARVHWQIYTPAGPGPERSVALFFQFGPKAPRRHPERRVRRGEWGRYGVADLRSGLRPNRGVMCKVRGSLPGPGRTTAELLSHRGGRRETVINLFFL